MKSVRMESVNCLLIPLNELPEGGLHAFNTLIAGNNVSLLVVRSPSRFNVYLNQCPHQGRRLDYAPGQFLTKSGNIICAAHGATFELASGLCVQGPCRGESLRSLTAEVRDGQLQVDVSGLA
jgi:nitrite reductase/ring-hydroxylating ferredoxin subunit